MAEDNPDKRSEKLRVWLKTNSFFIGLFLLAVVIRFYFFILTKNQPLWWDEAEYMSTAKSFAGIIHFDFNLALNRFPGFPLLASAFYILGVNNEVLLRFILAFLPSIIAIFLMYFTLRYMYADKRIALISIVLFAVLWENIFYSNRFHTENISLIFELLAIMTLFKVYIKKENLFFIKSKFAILWIALFSLLSILFRSGNMVFIPTIIFFLAAINFFKIPDKNKKIVSISVISLIVLVFLAIVFLSYRSSFINQFFRSDLPVYWGASSLFSRFYLFTSYSESPNFFFFLSHSILLLSFAVGILSLLWRMLIFPEGFKRLAKNNEDREFKADVLNFLLLAGFLFFFIFMLRPGAFETRWFFAVLPGLFAFTSKGIIKISEFIQSLIKIKSLYVVIIVIILIFGGYTQLSHANNLTKEKLDSYAPVRDSGIWIKENSNKEESIISSSLTQHRYYSEREVMDFYINGSNSNETAFYEKVLAERPTYLTLSVFEPAFTPEWAYSWPIKYNNSLEVVQAYLDPQAQQPLLIVYKINYDSFQDAAS